MSVKATLRQYILENFLFTDDQNALANGDSFLQRGIIDSTGIMEMILFIEEQFGVSVDDDEMLPENLDSIDNIVAFITKKKAN